MTEHWDAIVVGAGAAGLVAAERAASSGLRTLLLEKNDRPGIKILMSGGTRCNITHNTDVRGIVAAYGKQGNFLHSALSHLSPQDVVRIFEAEGVKTKVEDTGKIFPVSDRAADVLQALRNRLERSGATLRLREPVQHLRFADGQFQLTTSEREYSSTYLILTCGGLSYPGSGTSGDGYPWAKQFGHSIVPTVPALAPLTSNEPWVKELSGLTLERVHLEVVVKEAKAAGDSDVDSVPLSKKSKKPQRGVRTTEFTGSVLFTHLGLSGPAPMNLSRFVSYAPPGARVELVCDFLVDISREQLEMDLRQACRAEPRKKFANIIHGIVPNRLLEKIVLNSQLAIDKSAGEVSNKDLQTLVQHLKSTVIGISGTAGYRKAEVTAGGVALDEVDSKTMQSKFQPGLFFAGEILDLDGPIGGFNFQAAFATGWLAGSSLQISAG